MCSSHKVKPHPSRTAKRQSRPDLWRAHRFKSAGGPGRRPRAL